MTVVSKQIKEGEDAGRFGNIKTYKDGRITEYEEKPQKISADTVSIGVYVIRRLLIELLKVSAQEERYDFVKDILIRYKGMKKIYAYERRTYRSSIASVGSYYKKNMKRLFFQRISGYLYKN